MGNKKKKVALVFGTLPASEEIEQFASISDQYEFSVIASESICGYLTQTSMFQDLSLIVLPDHEENPSYLPGLEKALRDFDLVIIKGRLSMFSYQAVKAKWKSRFRLGVLIDNLCAYPCDDLADLRTIRNEVNNAADFFLVQTKSAENTLLLEGIEQERISYVRPFVEGRYARTKENHAASRTKLGFGANDIVISHFGQIEWEEGLSDLASAAKNLKLTGSEVFDRIKFVFCGIGSFSLELRDHFSRFGLEDKAFYVAPSREGFETVFQAADAMYFAPAAGRDRVEGEPFRVLQAMANEVPVISCRNPVVEELCGKHRFDFCPKHIAGLSDALEKAGTAKALKHNIAKKNLATIEKQFTKAKFEKGISNLMREMFDRQDEINLLNIDQQVIEAEELVLTKQYIAAIDLIESILKVDSIPQHHMSNLYRLIGDSFNKLGDPSLAKEAYLQCIEYDQYSSKGFIGLGTVGLIQKSYDSAVLNFQKAVTLSPQDEMSYLGLGLAFQGMGELGEALSWVKKSLEIQVDNSAAIFTLIGICSETQSYDGVEEILERYIELHPLDTNILYTLAGITYQTGNATKTLSLVDRILVIDPVDERAKELKERVSEGQKPVASTSNG